MDSITATLQFYADALSTEEQVSAIESHSVKPRKAAVARKTRRSVRRRKSLIDATEGWADLYRKSKNTK